ncbi:MAG TPA: hypothetical protein DCG19_03175 [Cryomorphaceae bacterium]|nr:hypothetical protein [Owenweeksia sp.]HAD96379.1 hypothetical protein [Cryomorphaceae bacterium]
MTLKISAILTLFFSTTCLFGQETDKNGIEKRMTICLKDTSIRTQMDMRRCVYEAVSEYQTLIEALTLKLEQYLSDEGLEKLRLSAEAWKNYYDKESAFIYNLTEERIGTMYNNIAVSDLLEMVRQRADLLESRLNIYRETRDDKK